MFDTERRKHFTVDWFKNLAYLAEDKTKKYLATFHPELLERIIEFKSKCTVNMTLFETIFTGVAFIGDLSSNEETKTHRDHVDVCSILIQFGNTPVTGGDTIFFNNKDNESPCFTHKFIHGGYIIGHFNEVVHGSSKWEGERGAIVFFVNKGIMENILKHGTTCYYWWHDKWLSLHKADKSMAKYKLISGRYVYLYNQPKQNGVLSSCMQDAVINAATHLGVKLTQEEMYQRCKPRKVKGTTIKELSRSLEDKLVFVPIPGIGQVKDGIEASLL